MFVLGLTGLAVGLYAADIPTLWFSPHWELRCDCHRVSIYIYDFLIPSKL